MYRYLPKTFPASSNPNLQKAHVRNLDPVVPVRAESLALAKAPQSVPILKSRVDPMPWSGRNSSKSSCWRMRTPGDGSGKRSGFVFVHSDIPPWHWTTDPAKIGNLKGFQGPSPLTFAYNFCSLTVVRVGKNQACLCRCSWVQAGAFPAPTGRHPPCAQWDSRQDITFGYYVHKIALFRAK